MTRTRRFSRIRDTLLGLVTAAFAAPLAFAESLTVVSWGGAYEHSQRKAYFEPFTESTGVGIDVERYNGGIDEIRAQVERGEVSWDVVDLVMADAMQACAEGLLEPIDHDALLAPAPDGTPPAEDFIEGSLTRCAAPEVVYSTVLAFDVRAFPGPKPRSVADLFDLERFPGKRALQRRPVANLEWALRAYGVPRQDIYAVLSTRRGQDLAFRKLDTIAGHIVWWVDGAEPARLLASGEAVIASGYNGRFFDAAVNERLPIQILWDAQVYDYSVWGIPRGGSDVELARQFVRFATSTRALAGQARYISYGPARLSAMTEVWKHAASGVDVRPYLPTYPPNFARAIARDHEWYARIQEHLNERFERWIEGQGNE